ncbi:MAG: class I SAM-dependent methyltransferase [Terriglobia bacterium]
MRHLVSHPPAAFDVIAPVYDCTFTWSHVGRAQREATRRELDRLYRPGQRILELNCGTGVDAVHLAGRGIDVLACDISSGMIEQAWKRADEARQKSAVCGDIDFRILATEDIGKLRGEGMAGRFDGAFSNFAGLNCVEDLSAVARDLSSLLKPGALLLVCVFGRFCLWEVLWYLGHAMPAKALRRLRAEEPDAHLAEGVTLRIKYPSVRKLAHLFAPEFRLMRWRGVGVATPPTYVESFVHRFPRLFHEFNKLDRPLGACPIVRAMADHVLLAFERRG